MSDTKTTKTKQQRNKEYHEKNPDHVRYLKAKSAAKSFINTKSTTEDLEELRELINKREESLKGES